MIHYHSFPDLQWLKTRAENKFNGDRWPTAVLNVKTTATLRDNIPGPLSLFSNVSGESLVMVDGKTSLVNDSHFFISNNTQRYTLEIAKNKSTETFNIHFGETWLDNIIEGQQVEFYNKLYPKDDVVKSILAQLKPDKTILEREELLTQLVVHLLRVNRNEKIRIESLEATKLATRQDIIRRLHLATDHIYSYYQKDISLDELSKISMLSKFHFVRAFRQAFGMAPHQFLIQVRIERAKHLLSTGLEVAQTGRLVGISDSSSFSRLFKNQTGFYPSTFRNFCHSPHRQES